MNVLDIARLLPSQIRPYLCGTYGGDRRFRMPGWATE